MWRYVLAGVLVAGVAAAITWGPDVTRAEHRVVRLDPDDEGDDEEDGTEDD